ncbi:MAG: hypothetical protein ACXAD7_21570 [Candidatus Kariarchaeaceae archaeon]|jgi:hypothetical protein
MVDCANLGGCNFFRTYTNDAFRQLALKGFVNKYCKGDNQEKCVRKIICEQLGNSKFVPPNMMPNGFPLSGSTRDDWSDEVLYLASNWRTMGLKAAKITH